MKSLFPFLMLAILIGGEYYMYQCIKTLFPPRQGEKINGILIGYLIFDVLLYVFFFSYRIFGMHGGHKIFFSTVTSLLALLLITKIIVFLFLFLGDAYRLIRYLIALAVATPAKPARGMTRSSFLAKVALTTAAIPVFSLIYGVVVNAYNYQFRKVTIKFPNLPDEFDGFRFIQISDIHSGSFTRSEPLIHAVEEINKMDADIILFTGDLVNNVAEEMVPYKEIFSRLRAKHGVLSTTGNHDYGDYQQWDTKEDKKANFKRFMDTHAEMGWKLLMNENHIIERNGQQIAIIGIENYAGTTGLHFPKYGKLDVAYKGTENIPFKILMSHDPSHWDAQVRPQYPDIDLTLSGHTHGFQFGIENKYIKWSPSEYIYKQWAGLYQEGKQYIYVNRGFGFLGYPGRVGILPEITEITLRKG